MKIFKFNNGIPLYLNLSVPKNPIVCETGTKVIDRCQREKIWNVGKSPSDINMSESKLLTPEQTYRRVHDWISKSDFVGNETSFGDKIEEHECSEHLNVETNILDKLTDITSVTKQIDSSCNCLKPEAVEVKKDKSVESISSFVKSLKKDAKSLVKCSASPWALYEGRNKLKADLPQKFCSINEAEETVCPIVLFISIYLLFVLCSYVSFYNTITLLLFSPY